MWKCLFTPNQAIFDRRRWWDGWQTRSWWIICKTGRCSLAANFSLCHLSRDRRSVLSRDDKKGAPQWQKTFGDLPCLRLRLACPRAPPTLARVGSRHTAAARVEGQTADTVPLAVAGGSSGCGCWRVLRRQPPALRRTRVQRRALQRQAISRLFARRRVGRARARCRAGGRGGTARCQHGRGTGRERL